MKKIKKLLVLVFFVSMMFSASCGNYEFLKGQIFAETNEENSTVQSKRTDIEEQSNQKVNWDNTDGGSKEKTKQESESTRASEKEQAQQVEKLERGVRDEGWEIGTENDSISEGDFRLSWNVGSWWYTYKGSSWLYGYFIGASLIINGAFPVDPNNVNPNNIINDDFLSGFLMAKRESSVYSINKEMKSLRRTFTYLGSYKIDIIQRLLENNAVEVTYQVENLTIKTQNIGLSQQADVRSDIGKSFISPINNFKGIYVNRENLLSAVIITDPVTMPNWTAGSSSSVRSFNQYNVTNANGIGWETGKRYRDTIGNLYPLPVNLKENIPINIEGLGIAMKNPGINVGPNQTASFKQIVKMGMIEPPKVTLNQTKASLYKEDKIEIDGTISDSDNHDYRVYLEIDDKDKTLIELADYKNIPYNEIQRYRGTIEGKDFSPGIHSVSVIGIDEYGSRSVSKKLELTIMELNGEPKIQKVKVGEGISNDLNTLFTEVKGSHVTLKNPLSIDTSSIGFQWVEATLTDEKQKEIMKKIPVNVYNPESTVFNDTDKIVLDAKDALFKLVDVQKSFDEGTLDELVRQNVQPKAWNMEDGTEISVVLVANEIQPVFGEYSGIFKGTRLDSGKSVQKNSKLSVSGELKFKVLPKNLDYKTTKLDQISFYVERQDSEWKIELENTIGTNWSLFASANPFVNQEKEKLNGTLILKTRQNQEVVIDGTNQKIATGSDTYPIIQWGKSEGLLLKISPGSKVGSYQGDINWLLSDAP